MKEILLSKNGKQKGKYVAIVDDEDFDFLNKINWSVSIERYTNYCFTMKKCGDKYKTLRMHTLLMNPPAGFFVDHINHNGLDNRKSNLRICTRSQNQMNLSAKGAVKYKGVQLCHYVLNNGNRKFKASIRVNGKLKYLGIFDTAELAALAYNNAALKYNGEFAFLNKF